MGKPPLKKGRSSGNHFLFLRFRWKTGTAKAAELSREAPGTEPLVLLMGEGEPVTVRTKLPKRLEAPFPAGLVVGQVDYYVNGTLVESLPVKTADGVSRRTLMVCARQYGSPF